MNRLNFMHTTVHKRYLKTASLMCTKPPDYWIKKKTKMSDVLDSSDYSSKSEVRKSNQSNEVPKETENFYGEFKEYLKEQDQLKIEVTRLRDDQMQYNLAKDTHDQSWFGYYQRQLLDRIEEINRKTRLKNPFSQNTTSNSMYPYSFYGEMTEPKSLDQQLNICRLNETVKNMRKTHYHSRFGIIRLRKKYQIDRQKVLRRQYLSGTTFVRSMPEVMQPFLLLSRIDKPIGYQLLFFPGMLSIMAATPYGCLPDMTLVGVFAAGTILTRGAGCTINDIFDHKLDAEVERCKTRPIPAGLVTVEKAKVWFVIQMMASFGLLCTLNQTAFLLGLIAPFPIILYPLAKRLVLSKKIKQSPISLMVKPQVALGMTFNWGALMGYSAVTDGFNPVVQLPLYFSCVAWTILYDTVYGRQDLEDDRSLGLSTMADFSNLIPKIYRSHDGTIFRSHRNRQTIQKYQQDVEQYFLGGLLGLSSFLFLGFAHECDRMGTISADNMVMAICLLTILNFHWLHFGTSVGKDPKITTRAHEFFVRQKWYGAALLGLMIFGSGYTNALRFENDHGQRVYPIKEAILNIVP